MALPAQTKGPVCYIKLTFSPLKIVQTRREKDLAKAEKKREKVQAEKEREAGKAQSEQDREAEKAKAERGREAPGQDKKK